MNSNKNNYCVYMHTNIINEKKYIGITGLKPKRRWMSDGKGYKNQRVFYGAITKYGWDNFEHVILYDCLTEDEAKKREVYLIKKYKSNDSSFGYNVSIGGDYSTTGLYNLESMSKPVFQYSLDGLFVREYPSSMEAQRQTGIYNSNITACCNGKHAYANDYIWRYEYAENVNPVNKKEHIFNSIVKEQTKIVYQYDTNGIYIKKYSSLMNAYRETGFDFRMISSCCRGRNKTAYGYIWAYFYTEDIQDLNNRAGTEPKKGKPVIQLKNENVIGTYDSILAAVRATGVSKGKISRCCNGIVSEVDGYVFKFAT